MMTVYNNNNDNDVKGKDLEKNGIEATNTDLTLTASNIGGDSPTVNNFVEGGSGPEDLSEASGNSSSSRGQDASSHGRNGWKMTTVLILGSLALAVATTADFDFFSKLNLLFSDKAKNGSIGLQVVGPERLSKKSENVQETFLNSRSLKKKKVLKCGDVVMNRKVSLKEDLTCEPSDVGEIGVPNAALTLDGPGAVLKCKGFKIVQSEGDASTCEALNEYEGNLEADPSKVEEIKNEGCGLPFLYGVKLLNGAKAVGCDIENFLVGAYVVQGAKELSDVTVSNNRYGVVIETNIENIENIEANNNYDGIIIMGDFEMSWKGRISLVGNNGNGLTFQFGARGTITIFGELTVDNNEGHGISMYDYSYDVTISIAEDASFSACGNGRSDIVNFRPYSFTVAMEGDGTGTCVVGSTAGDVTLPSQCESCPADLFF